MYKTTSIHVLKASEIQETVNSWTVRPRTKLFIRSNKEPLFWKNKLLPNTLVFDLNTGTWPTPPTSGYIKMILFMTIGGGGPFWLGRLLILYNFNCSNYTMSVCWVWCKIFMNIICRIFTLFAYVISFS